jgi:hypothetical protein
MVIYVSSKKFGIYVYTLQGRLSLCGYLEVKVQLRVEVVLIVFSSHCIYFQVFCRSLI